MGRKSSASIRFVQKMNRQMKDGSYPIYIVVCFGGRVEKATGVSCLVKYWDSKREEIKQGFGFNTCQESQYHIDLREAIEEQ